MDYEEIKNKIKDLNERIGTVCDFEWEITRLKELENERSLSVEQKFNTYNLDKYKEQIDKDVKELLSKVATECVGKTFKLSYKQNYMILLKVDGIKLGDYSKFFDGGTISLSCKRISIVNGDDNVRNLVEIRDNDLEFLTIYKVEKIEIDSKEFSKHLTSIKDFISQIYNEEKQVGYDENCEYTEGC